MVVTAVRQAVDVVETIVIIIFLYPFFFFIQLIKCRD
jgi:hypothetical protein